jgi:hypothetical protein
MIDGSRKLNTTSELNSNYLVLTFKYMYKSSRICDEENTNQQAGSDSCTLIVLQ